VYWEQFPIRVFCLVLAKQRNLNELSWLFTKVLSSGWGFLPKLGVVSAFQQPHPKMRTSSDESGSP